MIGIDFGTTNSAIAHVLTGEKPEPIRDPETGQVVLPSFVYFETPKQVIIGERARSRYYEIEAGGGSRIFKSIKRQLKQKRTYNVFGQPVKDTDIAAKIFLELKRRAEIVKGVEVQNAIVTIPVYFNSDQRNAVRTAAEKAGIKVKGFLHEPVAVAYPLLQNTFHTQNVLVFDWGGGTLDISLLRIDDGMIYELEVGGNDELGGDDIDRCVADDTFELFLKTNRLKPFELEDHPSCFQRLISGSETAKRQLSDSFDDETTIDIFAFYNDRDLVRTLSKTDFENITAFLIKDAVECVQKTLKNVGMKPRDVDKLILAGGSSQIPALIRQMENIFGPKKIKLPSNAESCVAEGAALVSYRNLHPVLSVPVGIELSRGLIHNFLERGTNLNGHIKEQIQFFVNDHRNGFANVIICESNSLNSDNHNRQPKGLLRVPVDKNEPENINVIYEMDNNQCLTFKGYGLRTQKEVECKIKDIKVGYKIK